MRKCVFISLLTLFVAVLTGCNNDSPKCNYETATLDVEIKPADWQFDDEALQFYHRYYTPAISYDVYNYGNWSISREYDKGTKDAYQVALPMSIFDYYVTDDNSVVYYQRYFDYRVGYGYIDFQVTDSDFPYPYDPSTGKVDPSAFFPSDTMYFRVQLIY